MTTVPTRHVVADAVADWMHKNRFHRHRGYTLNVPLDAGEVDDGNELEIFIVGYGYTSDERGRPGKEVRAVLDWLDAKGFGEPLFGLDGSGYTWILRAPWPEADQGEDAAARLRRAVLRKEAYDLLRREQVEAPARPSRADG